MQAYWEISPARGGKISAEAFLEKCEKGDVKTREERMKCEVKRENQCRNANGGKIQKNFPSALNINIGGGGVGESDFWVKIQGCVDLKNGW